MCNQNKIDSVERSDFICASFENRVRQPRIDEQNFSARRYHLEGRLAVPSELRVHDLHETEKHWFGKGDEHGALRHPATDVSSFVINSTFDIRHFTYVCPLMDHEHAHQHLSATDPRMAALIARSRRYEIKPSVAIRPFDALAESIAYQQLSGKAAATIFGRVRALFPKRKWLDPEQLLATPDDTLRGAGLSRAKTAALKDLAAKTIDGTVPSGRALLRMSDDEIIARLTQVRGIGRWTVEMLLLFDLGRPDVWPVDDYGVRKGFTKTFGRRKLPTPKQLVKIGEKWRPYRSVAAWYFWRALDQPEKLQS
jgi:DNA-3-methyladenine glycosylase II